MMDTGIFLEYQFCSLWLKITIPKKFNGEAINFDNYLASLNEPVDFLLNSQESSECKEALSINYKISFGIENRSSEKLNCSEMIYYKEEEFTLLRQKNNEFSVILNEPKRDKLKSPIGSMIRSLNIILRIYLAAFGIGFLHSSSVLWREKALLFTGVSGAGKTMLSNLILSKGGIKISDELTALKINRGQIVFCNGKFEEVSQQPFIWYGPYIGVFLNPMKEYGLAQITHSKYAHIAPMLYNNFFFIPFMSQNEKRNLVELVFKLCHIFKIKIETKNIFYKRDLWESLNTSLLNL